MSLKTEIAALRAEIDARARRITADEKNSSSSPVSNETPAASSRDPHDVESFLKMMNDTLDEFGEELDKYPRLSALAALGVGLSLGIVVGRQLR